MAQDLTIDQFMAALAEVESGGNPYARNPDSGAYGLFQIMPSNWGPWSREAEAAYGLPPGSLSEQTPENQYMVARAKIQSLLDKYNNFEDVAAIWYSGSPLGANADAPQFYNGNQYPSIRDYANKVMSIAQQKDGRPLVNMSIPDEPKDRYPTGGGDNILNVDSNRNGIPDIFEDPSASIAQGQLDLDREIFEYQKQVDEWNRQFQQGQFEWQKAMDERDYWLALGELDLANQAQTNANYWQQQNILLQQQLAQAEFAMAAYQADLEYRTAMASARSDAERNQIALAREQELAAIARMNDETQRAIAGKQLNIQAYDAETQRQLGLGNLAVANNEFIQRLYSNPRDHFGLFFMQRGVTPDWDQLAQGNVIQGDPLRVRDPLSVFTPTVTMPTDFGIAPGASYGQVGSFTRGVNLTNPQNALPPPPPPPAPPTFTPVGLPPQANRSAPGGPVQPGQPQYVDINPGGRQGGVPVAALRPGLNLATFGAVNGRGGYGRDFTQGKAFWDMGMTRPIGPDEYIEPGTQIWINWVPSSSPTATAPTPIPATNTRSGEPYIPPDNKISGYSGGIPNLAYREGVGAMPAYATGTLDYGFITDPVFMAGDSSKKNPFTDGAKPEAIFNPLRAPIAIANTEQTKDLMQRFRNNGFFPFLADYGNIFDRIRNEKQKKAFTLPVFRNTQGNLQRPTNVPDMSQYFSAIPQYVDYGYFGNTVTPQQQSNQIAMDKAAAIYRGTINSGARPPAIAFQQPGGVTQESRSTFDTQQGFDGFRRFASGTLPDVAGPLGIRNSANEWARGAPFVPKRMQTLMDYGMPIAPGTFGAVTGRPAAPVNVGTAFTARGGGILPSLQTLRGMTTGERANFQGYAEGPVGISYTDILDYLTGATANLGTAQVSGQIRYNR